MVDTKRIPLPVIALVSQAFSDSYSHAKIDSLFAYADAPELTHEGSKLNKTHDWLKLVNKSSPAPLGVLGKLLEDFLEIPPDPNTFWRNEAQISALTRNQSKVRSALSKENLSYRNGGYVDSASASPIASLQDAVNKGGLSAVGQEIDRAMQMIETDSNAAALYAGNILEASLKKYLQAKSVPFNKETATLSDLWPLVRNDIGLNPKDMGTNDLKKIASGLNSIVDGTMHLRNKKSSAHGKTDDQLKEKQLRPRHARLAVNSAATLSMYVLEFLDE